MFDEQDKSHTFFVYILTAELETYRRIRYFDMVREEYSAPVVEVLEVMVEKGFNVSPWPPQLETPDDGGSI